MADEEQGEIELNPAPVPVATYTSEAVRFNYAGQQFEPSNGVGTLNLYTQDEVDAFDAELAELAIRSPQVRNRVKKLSLEAAEEFIASIVVTPAAAQGAVDSATVKTAQTLGANLTSPAAK